MGRKKAADQTELLSHNLKIRVNGQTYDRLKKLGETSNARGISETARKIISNEKLVLYQKDMSLNLAMEELGLIRKELKYIGHNINQLTRDYNQKRTTQTQEYHILKVTDVYQQTEVKVERLLTLVNQLALKWLNE